MSGRSVQLSERVPRYARDEYFRSKRKTECEARAIHSLASRLSFLREKRDYRTEGRRKEENKNRETSRDGIKLVYRSVETDSSGFNIPPPVFPSSENNSAEKEKSGE